MQRITSTLAACALALTTGTSALAGTGAEGYFQLYNDTAGNVLIGFYTNGGDGWSQNWIAGVEIMPGASGQATLNADTGSCEQHFQASWKGQDGSEVFDEPIFIDICEASNVYLGDNEITYD